VGVKTDYTISDSYQYYRKNGTPPLVSRAKYSRLANSYYTFLMEKMIEGKEVSLPADLGTLEVVGKRPKATKDGKLKYFPIDWKNTNVLWDKKPELRGVKFIRFANEHSDFIKYKIRWRGGATILFKRFYTFVSSRGVNSIRRKVHLGILAGIEYNIYKS